jgi:hypothetical protein
LPNCKLDWLSDHSIGKYTQHLATAVDAEFAALAKNALPPGPTNW